MNVGQVVENYGVAHGAPQRGRTSVSTKLRRKITNGVQNMKDWFKNTVKGIDEDIKDLVQEFKTNQWRVFQKFVLLTTVTSVFKLILGIALRYAPVFITAGMAIPWIQPVALVAEMVAMMAIARMIWKAIPPNHRETTMVILTIIDIMTSVIGVPFYILRI